MTLTYLANAGDEATPADLGTLAGAAPPTVVGTPVKVGAKAIYVAAHGANSQNVGTWTWPSPVQYQVAQFWYRPTASAPIAIMGGASRGLIIAINGADFDTGLDVELDGVFCVSSGSNRSTKRYRSPAGTYQANVWCLIKLVWDCATDTFEFWVDGALLYSTAEAVPASITSITYGAGYTSYWLSPQSAYWDEIIVADGPLSEPGVAFRLVVS